MQIQVLSVNVSTPAGKKYQQAEVSYKNLQSGKIEGKKLVSFKYPEVFDAISEAEGKTLDVKSEKVDGFWTWTSIGTGNTTPATTQQSSKANTSPKSTYETPEERAQKQVYIVRQSSITNAIAYLSAGKKAFTENDILDVAKKFEAFVFDIGLPDGKKSSSSFDDLEDDIPM